MSVLGNQFHDFTLLSIHVLWETGKVRVKTKGPNEEVTITCMDVSSVVVPRIQEWGPSKSILSVGATTENDKTLLRINMQSGDTIELECKSLIEEKDSV